MHGGLPSPASLASSERLVQDNTSSPFNQPPPLPQAPPPAFSLSPCCHARPKASTKMSRPPPPKRVCHEAGGSPRPARSVPRMRIDPRPQPPEGPGFGAEVRGLDLDSLSGAEVAALRGLLAEHQLLCFPEQAHVSPQAEAALALVFDPAATTVWRDQSTNPWERYKAEHLGGAGTFPLPEHPATLAVGKGPVEDHHGLTGHLGGHRGAYGNQSGSQVIGGGQLQWHIDGAFWRTHPPRATVMRCIAAPGFRGEVGPDRAASSGTQGHPQTGAAQPADVPKRTVVVDYGDGASICVAPGATVFCSATRAYDLLTDSERDRAERTICHYSGNPFRRFHKAVNSKDGLRCHGDPTAFSAEEETVAAEGRVSYPLVWRAQGTGRCSLMPHTRCIDHLEVLPPPDDVRRGVPGTVVPREAARSYLHTLMRRAIEPGLILAQQWRPGDIAVWDNHSVWHSATGGLQPEDRRVMHLTAYDSPTPPCSDALCLAGSPASPAGADAPLEVSLPVVVALTIGQTPRPDLAAAVLRGCGARRLVVEVVGALDEADEETLRRVTAAATADGSCPLHTRLQDGRRITASEASLVPLLQRRLSGATKRLLAQGRRLDGAMVLCAGGFDGLIASPPAMPLVLPFEAAADCLRRAGHRRAIAVVPSAEQAPHSVARYRARGINVVSTVVEPGLDGPPTGVAKTSEESHAHACAASIRGQLGLLPATVLAGTPVILDYYGCPRGLASTLGVSLDGTVPMVLDVETASAARLRRGVDAHTTSMPPSDIGSDKL